ncbi:MAG: succinate dehydrogenase assembly factor 2 [Rhodospirillales bacterium]|nr:succinate dehydrogenase assembly factor 2 [Rhodospirillales bacterium]
MPQTDEGCGEGPEDARRKRLLFRSHHTGMKENDVLIGGFADRYIDTFSDADVAWLERLLADNNDIDLYNWILGKEPLPPHLDHPLMHKLIDTKNAL